MSGKKQRRGDKLTFMKGGFDFRTGKSKPLEVRKSAPKSAAESISESDHQASFFAILRTNQPKPGVITSRDRRGVLVYRDDLTDAKYLNHPFYIFTRVRHFPNGGFRHAAVAEQLKAEGVRPGAFDIYLDAARHGFNGLRIEMKAADGVISEYQEEEMLWLRRENYSAHVCFHYVEAMEILLWYCAIDGKSLRGYPPSRHAYVLPEKGHDEKCGCDIQVSLFF